MDNLLIYSLLGLIIVNGFLLIRMVFKEKSEKDIVRIVGEALKKGSRDNTKFRAYYNDRYITICGLATEKRADALNEIINALCDHLGVYVDKEEGKRIPEKYTPEKYIIVKKSKKA